MEIEAGAVIHQIDRHPQQAQGGQAHGSGHAPHLAIASLPQLDLQPAGWDLRSPADWWVPLRQLWIGKPIGTRRQCALPLNHHTASQALECLRLGDAFHLDPVAPPVPPGRIRQTLLQTAIAGEQQQAFAVGIKTAGGVNVGHRDVISEATPAAARFGRELAQHPVGLVEQQGGQRRLGRSPQDAWRARQRFTTPIEIISRPRSIEIGGRIMAAALRCMCGAATLASGAVEHDT